MTLNVSLCPNRRRCFQSREPTAARSPLNRVSPPRPARLAESVPLRWLVGARENVRQIEGKAVSAFSRRSVRRDFEGSPINALFIENSRQNTASSLNRQPQRAGKDLSHCDCFEI